jgi:hypothetical protein
MHLDGECIKVGGPLCYAASASGVKVEGVNIVSAYCSPNEEIEEYLSNLITQLRKRELMIITGDFNTRWPEFTQLAIRRRDKQFHRFIIESGLLIENNAVATCTHQGSYTVNDYTLTRDATIQGWRVSKDDESLSDHRYVDFRIVDGADTAIRKT